MLRSFSSLNEKWLGIIMGLVRSFSISQGQKYPNIQLGEKKKKNKINTRGKGMGNNRNASEIYGVASAAENQQPFLFDLNNTGDGERQPWRAITSRCKFVLVFFLHGGEWFCLNRDNVLGRGKFSLFGNSTPRCKFVMAVRIRDGTKISSIMADYERELKASNSEI